MCLLIVAVNRVNFKIFRLELAKRGLNTCTIVKSIKTGQLHIRQRIVDVAIGLVNLFVCELLVTVQVE